MPLSRMQLMPLMYSFVCRLEWSSDLILGRVFHLLFYVSSCIQMAMTLSVLL